VNLEGSEKSSAVLNPALGNPQGSPNHWGGGNANGGTTYKGQMDLFKWQGNQVKDGRQWWTTGNGRKGMGGWGGIVPEGEGGGIAGSNCGIEGGGR